jgi:hypothetical protein
MKMLLLECPSMRKKGYNKAIVAAARKMITIIWHMLNKKEVFKIN